MRIVISIIAVIVQNIAQKSPVLQQKLCRRDMAVFFVLIVNIGSCARIRNFGVVRKVLEEASHAHDGECESAEEMEYSEDKPCS